MIYNFNTPEYAKAAAESTPEILEYWERVRAGLTKPEAHDFGDDTASIIAGHRHCARLHIEAAARRMRLVEDLAGEYPT